MKLNSHIISHPQGSEAWALHRAASLNASDLAAAMGLSKYQTRGDLIKRLATGITPEVDAMTQARFDKGHANEAAAEPKAAEVIGEELYPMVLAAEVPGLKRKMSGSFDGLTLMQDVSWENKSPNAALVQSVQAGVIPPEYCPQMEQGLMLSGAEKCLFTVSDGEVFVSAWYESDPELRAKIIPTWQQIEAEVAAYVPPSPSAVEKIVAEAVEALPSVSVKVEGSIVIHENFDAFEVALRDFLEHRLIRKPANDQEFADLEVQIKAMKGAEAALDGAEESWIAQIETVSAKKRRKDMLRTLVRDNRLLAEKLLASEKERRRAEIVTAGAAALKAHIDALNTRLGEPFMPVIPADFGGAVRGLKSLTSMEDKVSGELARCKIAANEVADRIQVNMKKLVQAGDSASFHDAAALVLKAPDDLAAIIAQRIAETERRAEAAREAIRKEEQAKAEKEAREKLAAEQRQREADEALAARQSEATQAPAAPEAQPIAALEPIQSEAIVPPAPAANVVPLSRPAAPAADTGARIKLGDINAAIAPLSITADGLATLGFKQEPSTGAAKLYKLTDLPAMYAAMVRHIEAVQAKQAA